MENGISYCDHPAQINRPKKSVDYPLQGRLVNLDIFNRHNIQFDIFSISDTQQY